MSTLACQNLTLIAAETPILRGISLQFASAHSYAVTGPSGCGKTSLLNCLAGITAPSGGEVTFDSRPLASSSESERLAIRRDHFGFVLQFGDLVDELTVRENVSLPFLIRGTPVDSRRVDDLLLRLGMRGLDKRLPRELSGGQRQRVAVARAVAATPDVIFADEPTGALDTENSAAVMALLLEEARSAGSILITVTHDLSALAGFDHHIRLSDGRVLV